MPSGKVPSFTDYAGGQSPDDVIYICKTPFGVTDDRFNTLDNTFAVITKNITDGAVRFVGAFAPAVSGANEGAFYYNDVTDTFQGSRNTSAYQNLLFGSAAVTRVAIWDTLADSLTGFASFTYSDSQPRGIVTAANSSACFEVSSSVAATPSSTKIQGGVGQLWCKSFFGGPVLELATGASGPAFPTNGTTIGNVNFSVTNNSTDFSSTPLAIINAVLTQNATGGTTGCGLRITTASNAGGSTIRFAITGDGAVIVGANGQNQSATLGGTSTGVAIGTLTTYDSAAAVQLANPFTGPTTVKTLVVQANSNQTASIIETQSSGGGGQFQVRVSTGNGNHFLSLLGNSGSVPGVSVTAQWRIYCSSGGQLMLSENGGAYSTIVTSSSSTLGFFGTTPVVQQTMGAAVAGGTYGATEQTMLQAVYDAVRAYGLGT